MIRCEFLFVMLLSTIVHTLCDETTFKGGPETLPYVRRNKFDEGPIEKCNKAKKFTKDFMWGAGTSSYQIEGAWNVDGKGEHIWDHACHTSDPQRIVDGTSGDTAANSYYLHKDDVRVIQEIGLKYYRLSMSWPRILPHGNDANVNQLGLDHYDNVINELLVNGIQPVVTIFHWELPQALEDEGGMLNPAIVDYLVRYAEIVIKHFGDRVKIWTTFNEPNIFCELGYGQKIFAPFVDANDVGGAYLCNYHALLFNAKIYRLYHEKYNKDKKGKIGPVLQGDFQFPKVPTKLEDVASAEKTLQFWLGQLAHPIFSKTGGYPKILEETVRKNSFDEGLSVSRLPIMDEETQELIRGTSDFFFLNYYTSYYAEPANVSTARDWKKASYLNDLYVHNSYNGDWPVSSSPWLRSVPEGLRALLNWIKNEYDNPPVLITENGWSDYGEIEDVGRETYLRTHFQAVLDAIVEDGCNVVGHMTWSLIDTFEWSAGQTVRFGLYHVDYMSKNKTRTAKNSTKFLRQVIQTGRIPVS